MLAAATLVTVLVMGVARAQTEGVKFVEDIEQQAIRAARQARSAANRQSANPYAGRTGVPLPSQQSRFPQTTVSRMTPGRSSETEKTGWSAGFNKAWSSMFGGEKHRNQAPRTASASPVTPSRAYQSSNAAAQGAAHQRGSAQAGTRPSSAGNSSLLNQMATTRAGGIQTRPTTTDNKPRGLLQLWGSKPEAEQVAVRNNAGRVQPPLAGAEANRSVRPTAGGSAGRESWASKLIPSLSAKEKVPAPLTKPSSPSWHQDEMLAMVTDQQPAKSDVSKVQLASPATLPKSTPNVANQLPMVVGPTASTDRPSAPPSSGEAQAAQTSPAFVNQSAPAGKTLPRRVPEEIVNPHALATGLPPQVKPRRTDALAPAARSGQSAAAASMASNREVDMPANPVKRLEPVAVPPSAKAVELLTEANRLSTTAVTEDEYTTVIQLCRHVLAIDESPAAVDYSHNLASWALNRRGEVRSDEGRNKEAVLDFEDALRLDPNRWRAMHNRGVLAAQSGRFADAFDDFNRTIELNPKFAKAYSNRGALYVQAGKLEKASEDYRYAIALDPELAVAHKGRGRVCHMLGQFDLALQHFDAATLLAPNDARIVNNRGDLLTDMGRYRGAMNDYERAIELDTSLHVAYRNLAWLQATCPDKECRDPSEATANASRAMQLCDEPSDLEYDTLAAAQAAAGDFESAKAMMDKAIERAAEKDQPNYRWRKKLYEQGQAYVTEPASNIQQASYAK